MSGISNIIHPLINHPGRSQQERLPAALSPDKIKIDGRSMIDFLDFVYRFSRQVNFFNDQLQASDWRPFFENSLPFQLARVHKLDIQQLEEDFDAFTELVEVQPAKENIRLLFDFVYTEVIMPIDRWMLRFNENEFSFGLAASKLIAGNLQGTIKEFIALFNAANHWYCVGKRSFFALLEQDSWGLDMPDLFARDDAFRSSPGGPEARIRAMVTQLEQQFRQFIGVMNQMVQQAPDYLEESLEPLKEEYRKKHQPHLGLLFSFLRLFEMFQEELNKLSEEHLKYFFLKVLKIKQRPEKPDQAHLIFEAQKETDDHLLPAGTLFLDGKDLDNNDLLFKLNREILIDKAQVTSLRTFHLEQNLANLWGLPNGTSAYIEGLYIALDATMADGVEEAFADSGPKSWPALGDKFSKFIEPAVPPSLDPKEYPFARVGLVLASPVLLLREGRREVHFNLKCKLKPPKCGAEAVLSDFDHFFGGLKESIWIEEEWVELDKDAFQRVIVDGGLEPQIQQQYISLAENLMALLEESGENLGNRAKKIILENEATEGETIFPKFRLSAGDIDFRTDFWRQMVNIFTCLHKGCNGLFRYPRFAEPHPLKQYLQTAVRRILRMDAIAFLLDWELPTIQAADDLIAAFIENAFIVPLENDTGATLLFLDINGDSTGETGAWECPSIFKVAYSGEEGWVELEDTQLETRFRLEGETWQDRCLEIHIKALLSPDHPAVEFFNPENFTEPYPTSNPLFRLVLNPDCQIQCPPAVSEAANLCALEICPEDNILSISPYHFLRYLCIQDLCIDVQVCGVRNLIVQNDENLQDVNELVYPFGVRPTVEEDLSLASNGDPDLKGSNFYIGSQETFLKNWEKVWINLNWKDKPVSLEEHYFGYQDISQGITQPRDEDFKFQASILEKRKWVKEQQGSVNPYTDPVFSSSSGDPLLSKHLKYRPLFSSSRNLANFCFPHHPNTFDQSIQFERGYFEEPAERKLAIDPTPIEQLGVNSRDGFLRLTLKCRDFQHDRYSFVLARQMMAFGKFPADFVYGAVYSYLDTSTDGTGERVAATTLEEFENFVKREEISIFSAFQQVDRIFEFTSQANQQAQAIVTAIKAAINGNLLVNIRDQIVTDVAQAINDGLSGFANLNQYVVDIQAELASLLGIAGSTGTVYERIHDEVHNLLDGIANDTANLKDTARNILELIVNELSNNDAKLLTLRMRIVQQCQAFFDDLSVPGGAFETLATQLSNAIVTLLEDPSSPFTQQQKDDLFDEIFQALDNFIPPATLLEDKANDIISLIAEAFDENSADQIWVTNLLSTTSPSLVTVLQDCVLGIKNDTSAGNIVDLTIANINSIVRSELVVFVNTNVRAKIQEVVDDMLSGGVGALVIQDVVNDAISSEGLDSDISKIMEITEAIDYDACGIFNVAGSCTVDISTGSRFDTLYQASTDTPKHLPFPNKSDLVKALKGFCEKLDIAKSGDEEDEKNFVTFIESLDEVASDEETEEGEEEPSRVFDAAKLRKLVDFIGLGDLMCSLEIFVKVKQALNKKIEESTVVIPNEPYTPVLKDISLDYIATAQRDEVELIHLYPFDNNFKKEEWESSSLDCPYLLPLFEDEGTLFIGLEGLVPGNTLNLLFQLAEATADSEVDKAILHWYYLRDNEWVELRNLFHILEDGTQGLTRSGIVQIAMPGDIALPGSDALMPPGKHWLKVTARENTDALSEVINVHTQAALVTYEAAEGNRRAAMKVPAGRIAKLADADPLVKKVEQPYDSFGGQPQEQANRFHTRVSEHLRHKGRAVTPNDYEQIVLDGFPKVYRAKCVNHTFGLPGRQYRRDLEIAPGFVCVAVIPDLSQLEVGDRLAPRLPVSLLDDIKKFLKGKISPFIRLKVMNPRYEQVDVQIEAVLLPGRSNELYYKNKLEEDIRNFLAPWNIGQYEELRFGQSLSLSKLIHYVEHLEYIDYICSLDMQHQDNLNDKCQPVELTEEERSVMSPKTARSILTAGHIEVSIKDRKCQNYDESLTLAGPDDCKANEEPGQDNFQVCCDD